MTDLTITTICDPGAVTAGVCQKAFGDRSDSIFSLDPQCGTFLRNFHFFPWVGSARWGNNFLLCSPVSLFMFK